MDAFETIVKLYLEEQGYWVRQSVKVHISKEDKKAIGTFSMPTPEVDLVALNVRENELLLVEAKSFLDSFGVRFADISGQNAKHAKRYKLFTDSKWRELVIKQLWKEYQDQGLISQDTKITLALAVGHIYSNDETRIATYFSKQGWKLFTPDQITETVRRLSRKGWKDDLVTITEVALEFWTTC